MAVIEWILSYQQGGRISYEHCKVATMFLQALPFAFDSGPIIRQTELWQEEFERRRGGPKVIGIGLKQSLLRFGYMWFPDRIDWEQMVFRDRFASQIAFTSSMLRDVYRKNWLSVKTAKDDLSRLESAGKWLVLYRTERDALEFILEFIIQLILRSYRKEVFGYIKADIQPEYHKKALNGDVMLCYTELQSVLTPESVANLYIVDAKRTKIRSIEDLVKLLWGIDDQYIRDRWSNISFRALHQRAFELIGEHCGKTIQDRFYDNIMRYFVALNWLVPYPSSSKLFQKKPQKGLQWVAIYHRRLAYSTTKQGTIMGISVLRPMTERRPVRYRPATFPWTVPEESASDSMEGDNSTDSEPESNWVPRQFQFMEDWDLVGGDVSVLMSPIPQENQSRFMKVTTSIESVSEALQQRWGTEHMEEVE
jgi:hypothetical protein